MKLPDINTSREDLISFLGLKSQDVYFYYDNSLSYPLPSNYKNKFLVKFNDKTKKFFIYCRLDEHYLLHNEFGPAQLNFNDITGKLRYIRYRLNATLSRINAPAIYHYDIYGSIMEEAFYLNGQLHNSIGPAYRIKCSNNVWQNYYYINGRQLSQARINKIIYKDL